MPYTLTSKQEKLERLQAFLAATKNRATLSGEGCGTCEVVLDADWSVPGPVG